MKNSKSILVLLLGVLALAGVNVALRMYGGDAARLVRRTTLVDLTEPVMRISVMRGGQRVMLAKSTRWRLVEPFPGSVDESVVLRLLDVLSFTPIQDSASDSELLRLGRTRADFSLEAPRLAVALEGETQSVRLAFGAQTPSGDGVYAAIGEADAVYVMPTSVLAAVDLPVDAFRRRSLFVVGAESVQSFDIKRADAMRLSFVRADDGWKVDGQQASATKVRALVDGVFGASAVDFVWPVGATNESEIASTSLLAVYGLDPESASTVTFKFQDGVDRQVLFGKAADERHVYALVQNGGAIVTVPTAVKDLVSQSRLAYTDARLFPFEPAAVTSLTLADAGVDFALARGENGLWRLESPVSAPADSDVVGQVLENVLALSASDIRERGVAVSMTTNAAPLVVRREAVLRNLRFEDLRSREIVKVSPESVRRIVVSRGHESARPTSIVYGRERQAWNVESAETSGNVDAEAVRRVLSALDPLRSVRIVRLKVSAAELDEYGLGKPYLTLAIDLDRTDAVRRNVMVGEVTEGGRFATVGSSDAVFVMPEAVVSAFAAPLVDE